jgi:hypothetical protein
MSEDEGGNLAWWWIDYLENELDPGLEKDMEQLLQHSEEDRDSFERFRLLREWLRGSDPIKDWPVEERLTRMHCKVMREVTKMSYREARATKSLSV